MKYLIAFLLLLFCSSNVPALSLGVGQLNDAASETVQYEKGRSEKPRKEKKGRKHRKNKRKSPPLFKNTEFDLIRIAVYLSVAVGLSVIFLLFQPVFLLVLSFFLGFLWFLSGLAVFMSIVLLLSRAAKNYKETNEAIAAYLILFMLTRIILLIALFMVDQIAIATIFLVTFVPSFVVYIIAIILLLSTHNTGSSRDIMRFPEKEEKN